MIQSGKTSLAEWLASPNFNLRPPNSTVSLLVIHNISLPPGEYGGAHIHAFFQNQLDTGKHPYFETIAGLEVSAHCLIERNGRITQFVNFNDRAWHAGVSSFLGRTDCNDFSIGIELEGTDTSPYTSEQYQSLVTLAAELMKNYPQITLDKIVGHSDIAPERKSDPGPAFDWSGFKLQLQHYLASVR